MTALKITYPFYWILICMVIAIAVTLLLYFKDKKNNVLSMPVLIALSAVRGVTTFVIAFLLLTPLLKRTTYNEVKPFLVIAQDNSESIRLAEDSAALAAHIATLKNLQQRLSADYEVEFLTVGENISPSEPEDVTFQAKKSNISEVFSYVRNQYKSNAPGAIVLLSDGIYNEGFNPVYVAEGLGIPTYTVGMGDTTTTKDLLIRNVLYNNIAYLDDEVRIQVDIAAYKSKGQGSKIKLTAVRDRQPGVIDAKDFIIKEDNYFETFELTVKAEKSGMMHLRLVLDPVSGESTQANNSKDIYINVIDNRKKIAIFANAPHPDLAAFKRALDSEKGTEVTIEFEPAKMSSLIEESDAVILHQLPSGTNNISRELDIIRQKGKPVLWVLGAATNINHFNAVQNLIRLESGNFQSNDVEAVINSGFTPFGTHEELPRLLSRYPPVQAAFGNYISLPGTQTLLFQSIKGISTEYPLLAVSGQGGTKNAVLTAENIWRWRLYNYLDSKNHDVFDNLITQVIQYLTIREDKRKFRAHVTSTSLDELSPVYFGAELYNNNYQPVNTPDVSLQITDADGNKLDYLFDRTDRHYRLNAGQQSPGDYIFHASTTYNNENYSSSGSFTIKKVGIENLILKADHQLLYTLAEKTGGIFYEKHQAENILDDLTKDRRLKPQLAEISNTIPLIHLSWVGILLLLLFSAEWIARKYSGIY